VFLRVGGSVECIGVVQLKGIVIWGELMRRRFNYGNVVIFTNVSINKQRTLI